MNRLALTLDHMCFHSFVKNEKILFFFVYVVYALQSIKFDERI